jgi:hypothetical protein
MDNTLAKLLEYFKHIVRDLFVYVLSGLVVIANLSFIDYQFYDKKLGFLKILDELEYKIFIILIAAYIIGHILVAIRNIIRTICKFKICNSLNIKRKYSYKEIMIFIRNKDIYDYFIERQNQIFYIRRNLSVAFLLSAIIDIYFYTNSHNNLILLTSCILFVIAIILYCLSLVSIKNYNKKILEIFKSLKD